MQTFLGKIAWQAKRMSALEAMAGSITSSCSGNDQFSSSSLLREDPRPYQINRGQPESLSTILSQSARLRSVIYAAKWLRISSAHQCRQLSRIIRKTPDFGPYLPVSRWESNISRIIVKIAISCTLDFLTIKFQILCVRLLYALFSYCGNVFS